jgi:DNA-directed RNA polymerase subunit beta'
VAGTSDITQGLPRVQELFEARLPKGQAIIADISGVVTVRSEGDQRWVTVESTEVDRVSHPVPGNYAIKVEDEVGVEEGDLLASRKGQDDIVALSSGRVIVEDRNIIVVHEEREEREYEIPITARLVVTNGQTIQAGAMITEGSKNPHEIMAILGVEAVRNYMLVEIQRVYRSQGVNINDKHIEVIIRQMLRRVRVTESGDTSWLPGELVDRIEFEQTNQEIIEQGGEPAAADPEVMGITKAALNTDSFLSAASFQHTISVLASAAIEGKVDTLRGLKESVLIGKLIPAGTGYRGLEVEEEEEASPEEALGEELSLETDLLSVLSGDALSTSDADSDIDLLDAAFLASKDSKPSTPSLS